MFVLSSLPGSSVRLIKHIELRVSKNDDLANCLTTIVKDGLRYCFALEDLTMLLPPTFPEEIGENSEEEHTLSYYERRKAEGEKIIVLNALRWLPKKCKVELVGATSKSVRIAIEEHEQSRSALNNVGLRFELWKS